MRHRRHAIHDLLLRVGLTLAAACLASSCAFDRAAGVPNLLANQEAECDIGPSWNETPIWDQGEVRVIWRYHKENEWQGVCETSGWGCIHCKYEQSERVCTIDLRIRPRFSHLCHMAVLGHELGHALGKMHDEPQVRVVSVSLIPLTTPPATSPDSVPIPAPSANTAIVAAVAPEAIDEKAVATPVLEPLPEITPPHLYTMLELVKPVESAEAFADPASLSGMASLRLDRAQFKMFAPLH
jgi:hypothetical protein